MGGNPATRWTGIYTARLTIMFQRSTSDDFGLYYYIFESEENQPNTKIILVQIFQNI